MSIACTQVQPGAAIGCVKTISSPPAGIPDVDPSPSRRRWHCSAPHCSALACCAAAVSSNIDDHPGSKAAPFGAVFFFAKGRNGLADCLGSAAIRDQLGMPVAANTSSSGPRCFSYLRQRPTELV